MYIHTYILDVRGCVYKYIDTHTCIYIYIHILVARMNLNINTVPIALAGGRRRRSTALDGYFRVLRGTARVTGVRGCCGKAEGRVVMLSCAGAYVSGADGSNACPAGSVRIATEAACRTAAAIAGKTFVAVETSPIFPRGCFYTTADIAWFNAHAVGAGWSAAQPLCAALVTTGAPTA